MPKRCTAPLTGGHKVRNSRGLTPLSLLLLVSLNAGCATISLDKPHVGSRRVLDRSEDTEVLAAAFADVKQDGVSATVRASHLCGDRKTEQVQVTTTRERQNDSAALDWGLGVAGLATAGVGTGLIIDSRNVYPNDTASRDYNPYGQGTALGIGVAVTAVGAGLLAVAGVDVLRAQGQEVEVEQVEERSAKLANLRPCKNEPYSGLVVRVGGDEVGTTDKDGTLQIHLPDVLDEDLFSDAKTTDPHVGIFVMDDRVGTLSLTPVAEHYAGLRAERDEAKWRDVNEDSCRSPENLDACSGVREYLERYPKGLHVDEARKLLAAAEPALEVLRDDAGWARISTYDVPDCLKPKTEDACASVEKYLQQYPQGRHVAEAKSVLGRAAFALKALRLKREREERARAAMRSVIEVSRVRISLESPPFENSQRVYLQVTFDAMLKQAHAARTNLFVRAACSVAGRRMVDTVPVLDSLDDMSVGDTKEFEAVPFINRPLSGAPTGCSIDFSMGQLFGQARAPLGSFCYGKCD